MVIGFDVDGVIARAPLGLDKSARYGMRGWNFLLSTPLGKFLYNHLRRVDDEMREIICRLENGGHRIVIATYVFEKYRCLAEGWLRHNGIIFDKLVLAKNKESALEFKARAILEEKCDYFIEDHFALAQAISRKVPARVIHYVVKDDLDILPL